METMQESKVKLDVLLIDAKLVLKTLANQRLTSIRLPLLSKSQHSDEVELVKNRCKLLQNILLQLWETIMMECFEKGMSKSL